MAKSGKLTTKQRRAIAALLTEKDIKAAALAASCSYRALRGWLKDNSAFQAELSEGQAQALGHAARSMAGKAPKVVAALLAILDDPEVTNSEVIQVSRVFFNALPSVSLLGSIEQKLSELLGEK